LPKIQIKGTENFNPTVKISNNLAFTFHLPTYNDTLSINDISSVDDVVELAVNCIDSITTPDEVYTITDTNKNDVREMFMNLTTEQFKKIVEFFDKVPKYELVYEYTTSDGVDRKVLISGIEDFFTLASVT
jgi:hypothetical protein